MAPREHYPQPSRRIVIVGTTSAGKTTLARSLAERLAIPHVELDSLHWEANWTEAPTERFRQRVLETLRGDSWVVDGNYSKVRDIVWQRADTLIWLDYSLPLVLSRLTRRTIQRVLGREELWSGNRERLVHVFSRDSLYLWALRTHRRRRREYPEELRKAHHAHLIVLHFRGPRETRAWLREVRPR